jgi:hypothetical protein
MLGKIVAKMSNSKCPGVEERNLASFDGSVYGSADPGGSFLVVVGIRDSMDPYPKHAVWHALAHLVRIVQNMGINVEKPRAVDMVALFKEIETRRRTNISQPTNPGPRKIQFADYSDIICSEFARCGP